MMLTAYAPSQSKPTRLVGDVPDGEAVRVGSRSCHRNTDRHRHTTRLLLMQIKLMSRRMTSRASSVEGQFSSKGRFQRVVARLRRMERLVSRVR